MEIDRARVTFRGGGCTADRAATIAKLALRHVQTMAAGQAWARSGRLGRVEVPPVRLPLGAMSDEAAARAAASQIVQSLSAAARGDRNGG